VTTATRATKIRTNLICRKYLLKGKIGPVFMGFLLRFVVDEIKNSHAL
jgi:hypothetical protein